MRDFLVRLCEGTTEIPKKNEELLDRLCEHHSIEIISGAKKTFKLKSEFVLGMISKHKGLHHKRSNIFVISFRKNECKDGRDLRVLSGSFSDGDFVLAKKIFSRGKYRAKVLLVLGLNKKSSVALLREKACRLVLVDIKSQDKPLILETKTSQKSLRQLPKNCVLRVDLSKMEIAEVLGTLDDPSVDEKISLALFEKVQDFAPSCLQMSDSFGCVVDATMYPSRVDLRHLPFCTIDPSDARDHDDAIFFEKNTLYVAIADVSEYVSANSPIDCEARERGFSIYLPHKSIPMLPRNLSENICSLKEGEDRLAFVWKFEFSKNEVIKSSLFEAIIKSHKNITYDDVSKLLTDKNHKNIPLDVQKSILGFYPISRELLKKRLQKGYEFFGDEVKLVLDESGDLESVRLYLQDESHSIVEEAMLLANVASANMMLESVENRGIYRVHQEPREDRITELFFEMGDMGFHTKSKSIHDKIQDLQNWADEQNIRKHVDKMIIRAQTQANYEAQNIGHFGLGFDAYTHFTSPIRRYSDLCVHRILKCVLNDCKKMRFLSLESGAVCSRVNQLERESAKVEMDFRDRKFARWASKNVGVVISASVIDDRKPILLTADEVIYGARLFLLDNIEVEKLERIYVEIVDCNIANTAIFCRFVRRV